MNLLEVFEIHDNLNPKIWDDAGQLLPDVKSKIIDIVMEFENQTNIPLDIVDIQLVGSNASYNYNSYSDLDVHIIANFEFVDINPELLQSIYNTKKAEFNNTYDIKIHGIDIELYVQDIKSTTISNGIYSVCDDKWIKQPKPIKSITKHNTESELVKWQSHINEVLASNDYDQILNTINILYLVRHNSIAIDGEYGKGNQLFKELRNLGYLTQLKNALNNALSKKLSLESLTKGQLINRDI